MPPPVSDRDLRQRIDTELSHHPSLDPEGLRIAVHEGIVTLLGHVPSYAQKQAVEEALCPLTGVRGVANELEVQLPPEHRRRDAVLAEVAMNELRHTVQVPTDSIDVDVENGHLTLTGTVPWTFQRRRAEASLRYLIGVKAIHNRIEVETHAPPDNLKQHIRQALDRHVRNDAQRIRVDVDEGTVTLSGTVDSWTTRDQVVTLIQSLPGVAEVDNQLAVSRTTYA
jgi:osmotically-inducible protein OsmY